MAPRAFRYLAKGLTRSGLGEPCVVTLIDTNQLVQDAVPVITHVIPTRCIFVERQLEGDLESQKLVFAEPVISIPRASLPRQPRAEDQVLLDGVVWKIIAGVRDTGAGMCECPVKKT